METRTQPTVNETQGAVEVTPSTIFVSDQNRKIALSRLDAFLRQSRGRAIAVALTVFTTQEDAQDAVQEAAVRATLAADTYDPNRSFDRWFLRIVLMLCLEWVRQRRAQKNPRLVMIEAEHEEIFGDAAAQVRFHTALCNTLISSEDSKSVEGEKRLLGDMRDLVDSLDVALTLQQVPLEERDMLVAVYLRGEDRTAVAERHGISPRTLKARLATARSLARDAWLKVHASQQVSQQVSQQGGSHA